MSPGFSRGGGAQPENLLTDLHLNRERLLIEYPGHQNKLKTYFNFCIHIRYIFFFFFFQL
jgi:hypothetical protein